MALAGINNVSVLETPFFGENCSSVSKIWGNQEGPLTRTSIIRKMWRDLESENRTKETERQQTGGMADGNTGSQCSCSLESDDASGNTSEAENECPGDQNQMEILNGQENNGNLYIQRSPAIGTADKERVRQVFREWATKNGSGLTALNVSHKTNCSRAQSPCENERKRVRAVRQWIESNPQQEETGRPVSEEQAPETGCQVEQVCGGLVVDHTRVGGVRSPVRGRQAFLDLLAGFETERAKEMQILLESQLVSNCSNRSRLQALFRGRFLRNQSFVQDEKPSTTATTELGLLRQTNTVSDLRKGFLSGSDDDEKTHDGPQSDTSSDNDIKDHEENIQRLLGDFVNGFQAISTRNNAKTRESPGVLYAPVQESHERVLVNVAGQQPPTQIIENRHPCQDEDSSAESNHADQVETSQRTLKLQNPRHAQFQPKACRSPREYGILVEERDEQGLENELGLQQPPTENIENKDQNRDQNSLVECNHIEPSEQTLEPGSPALGLQQPPTEIIENKDQDRDQNGLVESNHIEPSEQTLELGSPALGQYQFTREELQVNEAFDCLNHPETNSRILACLDVPVETGEGHETVREKNDSECGDLTNTEVNKSSFAKSSINEAESIEERHERVSEIELGQQPPSAEVTVNRAPDQDVLVERSHGGYHIKPIIEEHDSEWDDLTNTEVNEVSYANLTEIEDEYVQKRHERLLENEVGQQPPLAEVTENRDWVRDQDVSVERSQCAYHIEPVIEEHDSEWDSLTNTKVNEGLYAKSTENEDESVEERHERVLEHEVRQQSPSAEVTENRDQVRDQDVSVERSHGVHHVEPISDEHDCEWDGLTNTEVNEGSYADSTETEDEYVEEKHERVLENEVGQQPPSAEVTENRDQEQDSSVLRSHVAQHIEPSQRTLELEIPARGQYQLNREELEVNESFDHHSETNSETLSWREGSVETEVWQEPTIEDNGSEWDQLTNTEIFEGSDANSVGNEDELYRDTAVNTEIFEGSDVNSVGNEDELYRDTAGNDFQESLENWHGVATSYLEAPLVVRTDIFYTSGDDNEDRPELRELMSRRRVSSLLQSDFRVRLDQVVQSYVERQDQAFESDDDWMFDHEQHHPDQQSVDENDDATETVEISEVTYPDIHQQSGTEWEIINGLRLDMAKLQERMNSMQSTLETCISMQLELQRSMQQEVSSALNRLSTSGENTLQTCSLCSDNNVHDDSSPNRRGHMYVCSNCAEKVNWSKLKESVRHP